MNRAVVFGVIALVVGLVIGYVLGVLVSGSAGSTDSEFSEDSAWRKSSIKISGSTTVLPIISDCAKEMMKKYPGISITVQGGGSGVGYSQVIEGVVDIGMASREPKKNEIENAKSKGKSLWLHPIALDAVCVVVHPSVGSLNLTLQEVGKIFAGIYKYWNEVRPDLPRAEIVVVVREPGSGTRATFEEYTMHPWNYNVTPAASVQASNPAVLRKVATTPYSIGYISFGFMTDEVKPVALAKKEGDPYILPTIENIVKKTYPISRYLYLVTCGRPVSGSLVDRFIDFVLSTEGQTIVQNLGYLKLPYIYPYE